MDEAVRIAFEAGLPYSGLRDFRLDDQLWRAIPPAWALRERVVPLVVVDGRLKLASARPDPDLSALDGRYAGIDVIISPAREIEQALAVVEASGNELQAPARPRRRSDRIDADADVAGRAAELGLPVVDLPGYAPDPDAVKLVPEALQRALRCVPLARDAAALYLAVADPPTRAQLDAVRAAAGDLEPRCFLASGHELDEALQAQHGERWAAIARGAAAPSGRRLPPRATAATIAIAAAVAAGLVAAPATTAIVLVALAGVVLAGPALLALAVALAGLARPARPAAPVAGRAARPALMSLLLPLPGGPGAAVRASATLTALGDSGVPLEVVLVCRADDRAGLLAARELTRRRQDRIAVAPPSVPRTRDGLLIYGAQLASGAQLAVLDPGDVPSSGLLAAARDALRTGGPGVTAAQAPLRPLRGDGPASPWALAAAAAWHELLAPGLARLRLPLPLVATGVVLERDALLATSGLDAVPGHGMRHRGRATTVAGVTVTIDAVAAARPVLGVAPAFAAALGVGVLAVCVVGLATDLLPTLAVQLAVAQVAAVAAVLAVLLLAGAVRRGAGRPRSDAAGT